MTTDTASRGVIKLEWVNATEASRAAVLRVIGTAEVSPSAVEAVKRALLRCMWWDISAGDLRRIVEANDTNPSRRDDEEVL